MINPLISDSEETRNVREQWEKALKEIEQLRDVIIGIENLTQFPTIETLPLALAIRNKIEQELKEVKNA